MGSGGELSSQRTHAPAGYLLDDVAREHSRLFGASLTWEEYQLEHDDLVDAGDAVVALTHKRGREDAPPNSS